MSTFYFSWADGPDTAGNIPPWESGVEDEEIVSFTLSQNEGDAATLNIEVRNPKRGLLSGQVWAFFSVVTDDTAGVAELFYGRPCRHSVQHFRRTGDDDIDCQAARLETKEI